MCIRLRVNSLFITINAVGRTFEIVILGGRREVYTFLVVALLIKLDPAPSSKTEHCTSDPAENRDALMEVIHQSSSFPHQRASFTKETLHVF